MSNPPVRQERIHIRRMALEDIPVVADLDRRSFSLPWSARAFAHEVTDNDHARCWVAEVKEGDRSPVLAGIAVVWLIVDEAHIATIAVEPQMRGQGIGRAMMETLLADARSQGMLSVTLEVRRSNLAARSLYQRFGFEEVGVRIRYYKDNFEDALILTVYFESLNQVVHQQLLPDAQAESVFAKEEEKIDDSK
jgi:ribosomal-protein-alanine N-acetyltransferase